MNMSELKNYDWLLDHARQLFIYHASQRHSSLRDFYYAFGLFSGGYMVALGAAEPKNLYANLALPIIGFAAMIVTWTFENRDRRNSELVHKDEDAQKEIEAIIAKHAELSDFEIAKNWEIGDPNVQYSSWVPKMFGAFWAISIVFVFGGIVKVAEAIKYLSE